METNQYIEMFLDESREHLQAVNDNLLKLENQPHETAIIDEIFRSAHTLKGMAAAMEYKEISSLTHQLENVLDLIRSAELSVTTFIIDLAFNVVEALEEMIDAVSRGEDGKRDVSDLIAKLELLGKGSASEQEETEVLDGEIDLSLNEHEITVVSQAEEQGLRIYQLAVKLNEDCMLKAARVFMVLESLDLLGDVVKTVPSTEALEEEKFDHEFWLVLLTNASQKKVEAAVSKISEVEHVNISKLTFTSVKQAKRKAAIKPELPETTESTDPAVHQSSSRTIRVNINRMDRLMNLVEEMVTEHSRLACLSNKHADDELTRAVEQVSGISREMQSLMLKMWMVPIKQVFNRFPRMVRGLANDLNKEVELAISGAETELDRTIIENIGEPLVHLIRNAIDHGIEAPSVRTQEGKSAKGTLTLRAFQSRNHIYIEIEDDGDGINKQKLIEKAIQYHVITAEQAAKLTDKQVYDLIFASGFSMADEVSDISGRGVGLDVVKNQIESLGGRVSVKSEQGKGSTFSIRLPLTMSVLSTLLVKVGVETYAVPLSSIEETVLLKDSQVMVLEGQQVMDFHGKRIPLVSLQKVFNVPGGEPQTEREDSAVVIVRKGNKVTGLVVDALLEQKEVILKSLGAYLQDIYVVSGAAILGSGQVSVILDPGSLNK